MSTRCTFREGDEGWSDYLRFIQLSGLSEVRSIDHMLNPYVDDCGSYDVSSSADVRGALRMLPAVESERQYLLLYLDPEKERLPAGITGCRLLGHDLSDETHTSSLLNCGPWKGRLAAFSRRLNRYGLLSHDDAVKAKALLPSEWPDEPHANVTVWALYEVSPQ